MVQARQNDRSYAIKISADLDANFESEVEILKSIVHPNIPMFVKSFQVRDLHCIVQEYIEGYPLSYYISSGYRFHEDEAKKILFQLLLILKDLHCQTQSKKAIVHRDLRLSNVLLNNDSIYLIDFGLAKFLDDRSPVGIDDTEQTSTYQRLRREISPGSDLFGAGVVAIDLFTNWVEDEALFAEPWEQVLPLSKEFIIFLKRLLSEENAFSVADEALQAFKVLYEPEPQGSQ